MVPNLLPLSPAGSLNKVLFMPGELKWDGECWVML